MTIISLNNLDSTEIKKGLLDMIARTIENNSWTQAYVAELLGIDQPKVSQIKNGRTNGFSLERLLVFLKKLGHEISISIEESQVLGSTAEKVKHEAEF
ncbi:MAG: helix-turn-helix transcriptional regulator [Wolbachia endosymbiont of Tyrophagus putrescentiae]|nr:helix-turn-helix transcriptional regulator [Wolbachia endosymbiont of Tyrophagus putrescentiae]